MEKKDKIIVGVACVAIIGLMIYTIRRQNTRGMLNQVANEGYETAQDLLFPDKYNRFKKLRYGPVLPGNE